MEVAAAHREEVVEHHAEAEAEEQRVAQKLSLYVIEYGNIELRV